MRADEEALRIYLRDMKYHSDGAKYHSDGAKRYTDLFGHYASRAMAAFAEAAQMYVTKAKEDQRYLAALIPIATLREQLTIIESFLSGPHGKALWDVLTALRGPDGQSFAEKDVMTLPIRRAAFPGLAADSAQAARSTGGIFYGADDYRVVEGANLHFRSHAQRAALALGLIEPPKL